MRLVGGRWCVTVKLGKEDKLVAYGAKAEVQRCVEAIERAFDTFLETVNEELGVYDPKVFIHLQTDRPEVDPEPPT